LSNLTTNTVTIPPKSTLCELQPATIADEVIESVEEELEKKRRKIVTELNTDQDNILDKLQQQKLRELLMRHKYIFLISDTDIGQCNRIDLIDPTPFKQRHRRIPPSMVDEFRAHL
jgi:hypothetical protein